MNNPLPTLNVQLLADVVTWAVADEAHMDELREKYPDWGVWNQGTWATQVRNGVCQTSYCIAGQACVQVGYGLVIPMIDDPESLERSGFDFAGYDEEDIKRALHEVNANSCAPKVFAGLDDKGRPKYRLDYDQERSIPDAAREALGIDPAEGSALFEGNNSITDVVTMATMIAKARGDEVFTAFKAALPNVVLDVMDEAWDGDWQKGWQSMFNRFYFEGPYQDAVMPPRDIADVLRHMVLDAYSTGAMSEREYERVLTFLSGQTI
jgi:hypothetical protein